MTYKQLSSKNKKGTNCTYSEFVTAQGFENIILINIVINYFLIFSLLLIVLSMSVPFYIIQEKIVKSSQLVPLTEELLLANHLGVAGGEVGVDADHVGLSFNNCQG